MFAKLTHIVHVAHNAVREVAKRTLRSPHWPVIERQWKAAHPKCAACDGTDHINVHHRFPFHDFPELELDIDGEHTPDHKPNFITLCMGKFECHLKDGHGGSFQYYNPNVTADVAELAEHPERRAQIEARALKARLRN